MAERCDMRTPGPLVLDTNAADNWRKFLMQFEIYLVAKGDMSRNARNGEFGNFDEISPKIKIRGKMAILTKFRRRAIELEIGVPTKRRF